MKQISHVSSAASALSKLASESTRSVESRLEDEGWWEGDDHDGAERDGWSSDSSSEMS